jgi:hypothetical protein
VAAFALLPAAAFAQGITLQEPTFSSFSIGTTVVVPDQGSTLLGGISRSASGSSEFGVPMLPGPLFKSRGIGRDTSASSVRATVFIHDFNAMDQALLGAPTPGAITFSLRPAGEAPAALAGHTLQPRAAKLAGNWLPNPAPPDAAAPTSLAQEQARRAAQQETRSTEAEQFFDRARQAEAEGKPHVARIYYQMAARRASGELKQQALAKVEALGGGPAKIAQGQPQ